jgi:hypothetical protein
MATKKTATNNRLNSSVIFAATAGYMRDVRAGAATDLIAAQARFDSATTDDARRYAEETLRICKSAIRALR